MGIDVWILRTGSLEAFDLEQNEESVVREGLKIR